MIFHPLQVALGGQYSHQYFNRYGDLRHISRLRFWPMDKVLVEKYDFSEQDANDMADFIDQILDFVPEKRPSGAQLLLHPGINVGPSLCQPADPADGGASKKLAKEKDAREALSIEMENIAIDCSPKVGRYPSQSNSTPSKRALFLLCGSHHLILLPLWYEVL